MDTRGCWDRWLGLWRRTFLVLRWQHLEVGDLYRRNGMYEYSKGFTPRAIVALVAGVFCALNGLVVSTL